VLRFNPQRPTFRLDDWRWVVAQVRRALESRGLAPLAAWIDRELAAGPAPRKPDQDRLDACVALLVAIDWAQHGDFLRIGDDEGWMLAPFAPTLEAELRERAVAIGRPAAAVVRRFRRPEPTAERPGLSDRVG
jgi:predicted RNase H-like nuclease